MAVYGIIWNHNVTHEGNQGASAMEIPIIEIANYPRFHDMAATTLDLATRLTGSGSAAIAHHDVDVVTTLCVSGPSRGSIAEGQLRASDSGLHQLLLGLPAAGSIAPTLLGTVAGVPVVLANGHRFGSLFVLVPDSVPVDHILLDDLRALARLFGFALDGERLMSHDRLTGLYNRALFDDHLTLEIARSRRSGACLCVLVVGCDFRDPAGMPPDTWWLPRLAERLRSSVRQGDTIARIGPREFALLVPDVQDTNVAHRVARTLYESLIDPFEMDGRDVQVSPGIGVAMLPHDGFDPDVLVERAIAVMQLARAEALGGYRMYSEEPALRIVRA